GAKQLHVLSPYQRVEAETVAWTSRVKRDRDRPIDWVPGIKTERSDKVGMYVTRITDLNYIKVNGVDFGAGASTFTANLASGGAGGTIELHLDAADGPQIGKLTVTPTGGWDDWKTQTTAVSGAVGTHDLFLVFKGDGDSPLFNMDYWSFGKAAQ
ncbi:MAG: carbohydrate-binding protein, partial [Asticcacaulis sp.]|nr:carbohydrate-binding protein [Asticcacaulis sp.]